MAGHILLGVYNEVDQAVDAVERVRRLGVPENRITVLSAAPIPSQILGRPKPQSRLGLFTAIGAVLGLLTALAIVGGTQLLYPIRQGGQPLWPIPPQLIILFELTMLGTMWATFAGFFLVNQLPRYGDPVNDPRIQAGRFGVAVEADDQRVDRAEQALKETGALDVQRTAARVENDPRKWWLWLLTVVLILGVAGLAGGLIAYDILKIPWFTQMQNQISTAYEQGPRLAAPAQAAPIQGPVLINGQPASQPVPADANSLQRGQILFSMHCALCHNQTGEGNGPISGFFNPKPANLTSSAVQQLPDNQIFVVITNGFGVMPSIAEDLTPSERWDVVNWVRTLKR